MTLLFTQNKIGTLTIPNRLIRSATAERMAKDDGSPLPTMVDLYRNLAAGGVGLIITGHFYVHPNGKAHPEMTGVYSDNLIPGLTLLSDAVHKEGGLIAAQINHGGMNSSAWHDPIAPSEVQLPSMEHPAREMTINEIEETIGNFGQAARRVKEAGFDGVQIHAAHGYLISEFLSPITNKRTDYWGGDFDRRLNFLREVYVSVRQNVGPDFPVLVKLGMEDYPENGLSAAEGAAIAAILEAMGMDAIEISSGIGKPGVGSIHKGVRTEAEEAYFRPLATLARQATRLPLSLVGGMRSRVVMESILSAGDADFISICRPLIREPNFPNMLKAGMIERSACLSANNCWAINAGDGIACKCPR
jgi:2,4-dienoyl-CoA reductase-like NADH-dependent reductase (Old Yellow Enzyme family)